MIEKYKFNYAERYAVWKVVGPICPWCFEPVPYADCHIDHIIPEKLLDDLKLLKEVLTKYALEETFEINSFSNWVHLHCNLKKQGKIITGAPVYLYLLTEVGNKSEQSKKLSEKWIKEKDTGKLIATIESDVQKKEIEKTTVSRIFAAINDSIEPVMGLTGSSINNQVFYVPSTEVWKVDISNDEFYFVSKNKEKGITPIYPGTDSKWLCSFCRNYGPWDSNRCLNCGNVSYDL